VPAVEVLIATPAVRNLIREGKIAQIYTAIQTGAQHGMQTMDHSLAELYRRGKITFEMAVSRAIDPQEVKRLLGREK